MKRLLLVCAFMIVAMLMTSCGDARQVTYVGRETLMSGREVCRIQLGELRVEYGTPAVCDHILGYWYNLRLGDKLYCVFEGPVNDKVYDMVVCHVEKRDE